MTTLTPEDIDNILPQTQCGLCGHGGCMPYAEALVFENAAINLCPPGGIPVLRKLGKLLNTNPAPYETEMRNKAKPKLLAVIREAECIGCTKCIQACPVDAILGSAKTMHTVISDECTGCELCVSPCPVDCIDLIEIEPANVADSNTSDSTADKYRARYLSRDARLKQEKQIKQSSRPDNTQIDRKNYLQAALERARAKKSL